MASRQARVLTILAPTFGITTRMSPRSISELKSRESEGTAYTTQLSCKRTKRPRILDSDAGGRSPLLLLGLATAGGESHFNQRDSNSVSGESREKTKLMNSIEHSWGISLTRVASRTEPRRPLAQSASTASGGRTESSKWSCKRSQIINLHC